jgi:hypothetical protein
LEGLFQFGQDFHVFGKGSVEWHVLGVFEDLQVVGMRIGPSFAVEGVKFAGFRDELSFSKSITRVRNLKHVLYKIIRR